MISESELKRQNTDLEFLQTTMANVEIQSELVPVSDLYPLPFLLGDFPDIYAAPSTAFQLMYLPAGENLEAIALLQIHLYTEYSLGENLEEAQSLVDELNLQIIFGHFGISDEGELFYRYVYALPRFTVPDEAAFLEVINLSFATFTTFGKLVIDVADGQMTGEAALATIQQQ